jgi:hypothetical protein
MKRLRDQPADDSTQQRGVAILQRTPATPPLPEMKRRVWHALQRERALAGPGPGRVRFRLAAAAVVLAATGTAGAMVGGVIGGTIGGMIGGTIGGPLRAPRLAERLRAQVVGAQAPVARGAAPGPADGLSPAAPAPSASPPRARPASAAQALTLSPAAAASDAPRKRGRGGPARAPTTAEAATAAGERTEVLDALVALRRERDPVRAGALLSTYLASHPQGALREEALALAIEAADARDDRETGEALSRTYARAYPKGRFAAFARRHLDAAP